MLSATFRLRFAVVFTNLVAMLCVLAPTASAQSSAAAASRVVVVQADRVLTEPGKAPRGVTSIVIENGRISAVLDGRQSGPAGARVIDLGNRFLLPGLSLIHI